MKLKTLLTWCMALGACSVAFTACSSDDDSTPVQAPDEIVEEVADEWVGTWNFSDFTLVFTKSGMGQIQKASNEDVTYYNFVYSYNKTKNVMNCVCTDGRTFTIKDIHLDSNGNLVVTQDFDGAEKTASGVKYVAPTDLVTNAPEQMVGQWAFTDFVLSIDKQKTGLIEYTNGSNLIRSYAKAVNDDFKTFEYTYSPSQNTLYCTPSYDRQFTFSNITFSSDGTKMTATYKHNSVERTETATKNTFTALTQEQLVGKWYSESKDDEYFSFSADGTVRLYGEDHYTGTWRTDGYSIYVTLEGKPETEVARYITISGDVMKLQVYTWAGGWRPYELTRLDDGGNCVV